MTKAEAGAAGFSSAGGVTGLLASFASSFSACNQSILGEPKGRPLACQSSSALSAVFAASPNGMGMANEFFGNGFCAGVFPSVGADEDGKFFASGEAFSVDVDDPGTPVSGRDALGGVFASASTRPNRAVAWRILKKYIATIAIANAISSAIVNR